MAQRPRELFPERSARHALGAELRRLRLDRGLSQARLGELTHHSGALIGKIEKAERLPTAAFCAGVDAVLDAGDRLSRMWPTADLRACGVPVDLVVSPWAPDTSLHLLRDVVGKPERHREFVALTGANLDTVLAGWAAAVPAAGPGDSGGPRSGGTGVRPGALHLIAGRLGALDTLSDTLAHAALRDLAFAELRCLTGMVATSTLPTPDHRRLLGVTAGAARLCGRLVHDVRRPGPARTYHLVALRCAASAADHAAARTILTEMSVTATLTGHPDDARTLREVPDRHATRKEESR